MKLGQYFKANPNFKENSGAPNTLQVFSCNIGGSHFGLTQSNRVINTKYLSTVCGAVSESGYDCDISKEGTLVTFTEKAKKFKYIDIYVYASGVPTYGWVGVQTVPIYLTGGYSYDDVLRTNSNASGVYHRRYEISNINYFLLNVWVENDSTYSGYAGYVSAAPYKIVLSNE